MCEEKGHLVQECPQISSTAVTQSEQTYIVNTKQTSCAESMLFPATNPALPQTITAETSTTAQV